MIDRHSNQQTITLTMSCDDLKISLTEEIPGVVHFSEGAMSIDSGLRPAIDRMAFNLARLIWDTRQDK